MEAAMIRTLSPAAVVLTAFLLPTASTAAPADSGRLRWVRGVVTATSADSLTLKLRDKEFTIGLDAAFTPPPVGRLVEAHYSDARNVRTAVLIFEADSSAALSKRPGTSYRGIVQRIKRGTVSLTANTKSHGVSIDRQTRLVGADGRAVANGAKAITAALPPGEDVLIKYEDDSAMTTVGDVLMFSGSDKALEIRKLQ
jgi:hypothetical protein